jgi:regulator of protease activity HflC (stomatin/prohibitin superfamily)
MIAIILAIVFVVAGIIVSVIAGREEFGRSWVFSVLGFVIAIAILVGSCIAIVPTGYTGILTTFGKVEDRTVSSGFNFIAPWQKIVKMDNRTQKVRIETSAFSSDIQQVDIQISVNYCINQATAQELYRTVGENYYENVMFPRIQENTKAVFSRYTAENLVAKRDELSDMVAESTAKDLESYGITIVSISIEDIDFTDAFTNAVEAKQVAAQNKLTAETEQAQKTMEEQAAAERAIISAQAEADQSVIAANADLEVTKIQAEAALYAGEKEAEMNRRISESLTEALIKYYWIKGWNGMLPETVLSNDGSYMIDLR